MTAIQKLPVLDPRIPAWSRDELLERQCPLCNGGGRARFERPDGLEVRHCETCDLWFVSPGPTDAALGRFYRDYAATHRKRPDDEVERAIRAQQPSESLIMCELMSSMNLSGKTVLDVGCGKGAFLHLAERAGARGFGVDLDLGSVRFAHDRVGLLGVQCGTIADLDLASRFDVVTMLDFVEHPLDVLPTLQRAADLLQPGGLLVIWTPNASSFTRSREPLALRVDLEHMQYFSFKSVARLAGALDLAIVHLEACGEPDLGMMRPAERTGLGSSARKALRGIARRAGLAGLRGRLAQPTPFAERRGDYCLFTLLQKPFAPGR